ncbi:MULTISPECIES: hypothetical protein [Enterobacter]|uniref:Uncharacterized protein n=1 Tax=Enterobacter mori TaxID=539813 RepID=A0A9Q7NRM2_9ENTR|nr:MULTISPECIES: hypothetical protein [Enterobacter]MCC8228767.1 hypothetical protein [Enterobacter mori]MCC8238154.1 hypothetical protein [Enterobacter mori]MCR1297335.1 hypothetical protein [Enterobacter kobei]RTQ16651.1 hypothetical protein EKN29_23955 [Enterobacter mori]
MSEGFGLIEKVEQLEKELAVQKTANHIVFGALINAINALYPNKDLHDGLAKLVQEKLDPERVQNIPNLHEAFLEAAKILRTDASPE